MDLAIEFIKGTDSKNKFKFFCLNIGSKLRIINVIMTYIITDPCVGTCDTACVEVCPVDCIHGPDDPEGSGEEAKEEKHRRGNRGEEAERRRGSKRWDRGASYDLDIDGGENRLKSMKSHRNLM